MGAAASQAPGEVPVVLVHGALRTRLGLWPTARMLSRHGLSPHLFGYTTRRASLEEHAAKLAEFLAARGLAGAKTVGFVTHSMGGLVVRATLRASHLSGQVRVVMMSPPNQGAQLAARNASNPAFRWLYGRAADELQPRAVANLGPLPPRVEALVLAGGRGHPRGFNPAIAGDDDGVVAVDEMALPGAAFEHVGGTHPWLQWRPTLVRRAAHFILTGR